MRLIGFSDSACRAQEDEGSGLALRGLAVVLTTDDLTKPTSPSGRVHLLDFLVRRLRRVVRSTFAAELNAFIDALESLILLQLVLHQVFTGTEDEPDELQYKLEHGVLYPPIELVTDARSVWDAFSAKDRCTPHEASMRIHLLSVRDRVQRRVLRAIWWSDTRDMVADPPTKGGTPRALIMAVSDQGRLQLCHEARRHPVTDVTRVDSGGGGAPRNNSQQEAQNDEVEKTKLGQSGGES